MASATITAQTEYGVTLLVDPQPGKRGKGMPDLNSSLFLYDLAQMISENLELLVTLFEYEVQLRNEGISSYLLNQANAWFMEVDVAGMNLHLPELKKKWLMASWAVMICAEMQVEFPFEKYSLEQRKEILTDCIKRYVNEVKKMRRMKEILENEASIPLAMHLLPRMTMERLSLHHELVARNIGIEKAMEFKTIGIPVSQRIGSLKRHFDQAHWQKMDEDHLVHLLWNFMALYHTIVAFGEPEKPKSERLEQSQQQTQPHTQTGKESEVQKVAVDSMV